MIFINDSKIIHFQLCPQVPINNFEIQMFDHNIACIALVKARLGVWDPEFFSSADQDPGLDFMDPDPGYIKQLNKNTM